MGLEIAFLANNSSGDILAIDSADGVNWSGAAVIGNQHGPLLSLATTGSLAVLGCSQAGPQYSPGFRVSTSPQTYSAFSSFVTGIEGANAASPSVCALNGVFFAAAAGYLVSSPEGVNWQVLSSVPLPEPLQTLVAHEDRIFAISSSAWTSSSDGKNWSAVQKFPHSTGDPFGCGAVSFNGGITIAYINDYPSQNVLLRRYTNGGWSNEYQTGQLSYSAPTFAVMNGTMYMAITQAGHNHDLLILPSPDGVQFSGIVNAQQYVHVFGGQGFPTRTVAMICRL